MGQNERRSRLGLSPENYDSTSPDRRVRLGLSQPSNVDVPAEPTQEPSSGYNFLQTPQQQGGMPSLNESIIKQPIDLIPQKPAVRSVVAPTQTMSSARGATAPSISIAPPQTSTTESSAIQVRGQQADEQIMSGSEYANTMPWYQRALNGIGRFAVGAKNLLSSSQTKNEKMLQDKASFQKGKESAGDFEFPVLGDIGNAASDFVLEGLRGITNVAATSPGGKAIRQAANGYYPSDANVWDKTEFQKGREQGQQEKYNQMGTVEKFYTDVKKGIGSSVPSVMLGGVPGLALMGTLAGGQNAQDALNNGATPIKAATHGLITGTAEAVTEKLFGVVPGLKMFDEELKGLSGNMGKNVGKIIGNVVRKATGEGFEEVIMDPVTGLSQKALYQPDKQWFGKDAVVDPKQMAYDFLIGTGAGVMMVSPQIIGNVADAKAAKTEISQNIQKDLYTGHSMPENYESNKKANDLLKKGSDTTIEEYRDYLKTLEREIPLWNNQQQVLPDSVPVPQAEPLVSPDPMQRFNDHLRELRDNPPNKQPDTISQQVNDVAAEPQTKPSDTSEVQRTPTEQAIHEFLLQEGVVDEAGNPIPSQQDAPAKDTNVPTKTDVPDMNVGENMAEQKQTINTSASEKPVKDKGLESVSASTEKNANFKKGTFNITYASGETETKTANIYKGVAIHKNGGSYVVSHERSGHGIATFATEKQAKLYARILGDTFDMKQGADQVFKTDEHFEFNKRLKEWVHEQRNVKEQSNADSIKAGISDVKAEQLTPDEFIDKLSVPGNTVSGFTYPMRYQIMRELVNGIMSETPKIRINVRGDGRLTIHNTPEAISTILDVLKIKMEKNTPEGMPTVDNKSATDNNVATKNEDAAIISKSENTTTAGVSENEKVVENNKPIVEDNKVKDTQQATDKVDILVDKITELVDTIKNGKNQGGAKHENANERTISDKNAGESGRIDPLVELRNIRERASFTGGTKTEREIIQNGQDTFGARVGIFEQRQSGYDGINDTENPGNIYISDTTQSGQTSTYLHEVLHDLAIRFKPEFKDVLGDFVSSIANDDTYKNLRVDFANNFESPYDNYLLSNPKILANEIIANEFSNMYLQTINFDNSKSTETGLSSDDILSLQNKFRGFMLAIRNKIPEKAINELPLFSMRRKEPVKPFFSKLQQTLESKLPNKATPDVIYNLVHKNGVKQDEIKWSGLSDFLRGKEKVDKNELLDFLRMNELQIEEITKLKPYSITGGYFSKEYEKRLKEIEDLRDRGGQISHHQAEIRIAKLNNEFGISGESKFDNYQLRGGRNYRELLFTLPIQTEPQLKPGIEAKKDAQGLWNLYDKTGEIFKVGSSSRAALMTKAADDTMLVTQAKTQTYRSSHWDEPNALAHVRLNDRVDSKGNKVLFIEEIQSDWHQEGRKKGYRGEGLPEGCTLRETDGYWVVDSEKYGQEKIRVSKQISDAKEMAIRQAWDAYGGVPDAPFQKTWHEFVIKRLIRYAAENGYVKIAWTTGAQQSERYSLTKHIKEMAYWKDKSDIGEDMIGVSAVDLEGHTVLDQEFYKLKDLAGTFGQEIADEMLSGEGETWSDVYPPSEEDSALGTRYLRGEGLKVGGNGMKGFYDKIIPDFLNSYGKRWQAKVEPTEITLERNVGDIITPELLRKAADVARSDGDMESWDFLDGQADKLETTGDYNYVALNANFPYFKYIEKVRNFADKNETVHSFPVTESMKDSVMNEGQPLFSYRRKEETIIPKEESNNASTDKKKKSTKYKISTKEGLASGNSYPNIGKASGLNTTGKSKRASEIFADFAKKLDVTVRHTKVGRNNLGEFWNKTHLIKIRHANDIPTLSHEVGHYLDKLYDLSTNRAHFSELEKLGKVTSRPSYSKDRIRREGVAEFVRLYLTDNDVAKKSAPGFYTTFESELPTEIVDVLQELKKDIWSLVNLDPVSRVEKSIDFHDDHTFMDSLKEVQNVDIFSAVRKVYTGVVDANYPLEWAAGKADAQEEIQGQLAQLRGYEGIALFDINPGIEKGMYQMDLDGKRVGRSYGEITKPLHENNEIRRKFMDYQVARRAEDYFNRGLKMPDTLETYREAVAILELKYPEFKKIFDELLEYRENLSQLMVEGGIYSQEQVDDMRKANPNYVSLKRIMEGFDMAAGSGKLLGSSKKLMKKLQGSGRDILDPEESDISNTFLYRGAAMRNRVLQNLTYMFDHSINEDAVEGMGWLIARAPHKVQPVQFNLEQVKKYLEDAGVDTTGLDLDTIVRIFVPNYLAKENQIVVYRDGKPVLYDVHPELYTSIEGMRFEQLEWLTKPFAALASIQRAGIIFTDKYILYNFSRDALHGLVSSKANITPIDVMVGAIHALFRTQTYKDAMKAGASTNYFSANDRDYTRETIKDIYSGYSLARKFTAKLKPNQWIRTIRDIIEPLEMSGRVAEYKKMLELTGNEIDAVYAARDLSIDFRRMGSWVKALQLNRVSLFLNSGIQGVDKTGRMFRYNPIRTTLKGLLWLTIPTILLWFLNKDNEHYKNLPYWRKDFYWNVPIGDPKTTKIFFPIPRPFELGIMFCALPERILNSSPNMWKDFDKTIRQMLPSLQISAIQPEIDIATNRNWQNRPIISQSDERVSPELQYNNYTSEIAKGIGAYFGASPKKIEHLITGHFGTLGTSALNITDNIIKPEPNSNVASGVFSGLGKKFIVDAQQSPQSVNDFYDNYAEVQTEYNDAKRLGKEPDAVVKSLNTSFTQAADKLSTYRDWETIIDKGNSPQKALMKAAVQEMLINKTKEQNIMYEAIKKMRKTMAGKK